MAADYQQRLAELRVEAQREWQQGEAERARARRPSSPARRPSWSGTVASAGLKVLVIVALPFLAMVRAAVFFYRDRDYPTWAAVGVGAGVAILVVTAYGAWLSRRVTGRTRVRLVAKWVALPIVAGWCGYALLVMASINAKTEEVREHYTATHPVLRIALATVILADGSLLVTDFGREREDYAVMGLPVNDRTLHYRQRDGWVHAADLRTIGHLELRNLLIELYFRLMGLRTLRHVGTADHLHVELPVR